MALSLVRDRTHEAVKVQFGSCELFAVDPAGAVLIFRGDNRSLVTQAGAISDHLAHEHPDAMLSSGNSTGAKAEAHRWSAFVKSFRLGGIARRR